MRAHLLKFSNTNARGNIQVSSLQYEFEAQFNSERQYIKFTSNETSCHYRSPSDFLTCNLFVHELKTAEGPLLSELAGLWGRNFRLAATFG